MVNTERENFRFDRVTAEKLKKLAEAAGLSKSDVVRILVDIATPEMLTKKKTERVS